MRDDVTPIRQQYLRIKRRYPQAIVLFRLGDFYETFDEDAKTASRELEIVLTSREMGKGNKVPMAGIPYHAIDNYLAKLINRGYRVAICEQMTKPGAKGIVQREVIRVVTPGTIIEPGLLESKKNNYLASLVVEGGEAGLASIDITTSEFSATQLPLARVRTELERLKPSEIIAGQDGEVATAGISQPVTRVDNYWFDGEVTRQTLLDHFHVTTLEGFGLAQLPLAARAAGAIIHYLEETQKGTLEQVSGLSTYSTDSFMALDERTQANLELFKTATGAPKGSLLSVIDMTKTPMGGRLLKRWFSQPLLDIGELIRRQDAIAWFVEGTLVRVGMTTLLNQTADLERLVNRIAGGHATATDLIALRRALEKVPEVLQALGDAPGPMDGLKAALKPHEEVIDLISRAITEEPGNVVGEGGVIRAGFSEDLDNTRSISTDARKYLAGLEKSEQEKTGIKSLRISYSKVFGYYIEVSKPNLPQVPPTYIRKQTVSNGERFFTPELKDYESTILNAKDRISELEKSLFQQVCKQIAGFRQSIMELASALAHLDVYSSLAEVAVRYSYCRPALTSGDEISITRGRHPVVERSLADTAFVPNDVRLSNKDDQIIILTGPNMAGKSTYLKQVALIVLMAQTGSYVPAEKASIGLVDRIFTRIGAREDLISGQSTFMVEMVETAGILNNATSRSLLVLDEIGRGTSTYDGLSIARAVVEYIHNHPRLGAKTLFATHYHEMVQMADYLPRVRNFNVAVKEERGEVIFMRRIVPGGVDRSFGVHVGRMAGLPRSVVHRAQEILDELESGGVAAGAGKRRGKPEPSQQMAFFAEKSPVLEELTKLDVDSLTPLEALTKLFELQKQARR